MTNSIKNGTNGSIFHRTDYMNGIDLIIQNFFNDLAKYIIEVKKIGGKISYGTINPTYVERMHEIAKISNLYTSSFNCGESAVIASKLIGENVGLIAENSMDYSEYIELICSEFENWREK